MNKTTSFRASFRHPSGRDTGVEISAINLSPVVAARCFVECDDSGAVRDGEEHAVFVWPPGEPEKVQEFVVTVACEWTYRAKLADKERETP